MRRNEAHIRRGLRAVACGALLAFVPGCQEEVPTALDDSPLPDEPLTFEVQLPWSDFGSSLQVLGGYALPSSVSAPYVAHTYQGALESRALVRFGAFPTQARVFDDDGNPVVDSDITYISGRLTLAFDTASAVAPGPVTIQVSALQEEWDARTTTWTYAVDSIGDQRTWSEPGAGPVTLMGQGIWDPTVSDSVTIAFDSTATAEWVDAEDQSRGGRIEAMTDGVLLRLTRARFRVDIRSTINPDTLAQDSISLVGRTFVYSPEPSAPTGVRVGGVPAWRAVMDVSLPQLTGPPALCASVGCPYTVEAGQISYAAIELTSQASDSAFQPVDSLRVDVRPVLTPSILPKSPLGTSQTGGFGTAIAPEAFGASPGTSVQIPITGFLRTLLSGPDAFGQPPPSTFALLAAVEPSTLSFATFDGPTDLNPPVMKLILTVGRPQELP